MKQLNPNKKVSPLLAVAMAVGFLLQAASVCAQEFEPRRWSHLPADMNFAGAGVGYTRGDIGFDPVLELEDVTMDMGSFGAKYIRTMKLLNRSARVDVSVPYRYAHWEGLLKGEPASTHRSGFADPRVRVAMNLLGAPPLRGADFANYRAEHPVETTVGAAIGVQLPLGEYEQSKLLNLGQNRFVFRPALGVVHTRRKWTAEMTGSVLLFTDNRDFWGDNIRRQDPLYILQGHLVYTFRPGLWVSGGTAFGYGGDSTVNYEYKYDQQANYTWVLSGGYPLTRTMGLKLSYIGTRTEKDTGADTDSLAAGYSIMW